jgi:hypothetical protein
MEAVTALLATLAFAATPPERVTFENSYGTVTLDHPAHLERHISCKECHGPGIARSFKFESVGQAHTTCRGCHEQAKRGPTACNECHVMPGAAGTVAGAERSPEAPRAQAAEAKPPAAQEKQPPLSEKQAPSQEQPPAATATAAAAGTQATKLEESTPTTTPGQPVAAVEQAPPPGKPPEPPSTRAAPEPEPAGTTLPTERNRWAEVGPSVLFGGGSGPSGGVGFQIAALRGRVLGVQAVDWCGIGQVTRVAGLLGGGTRLTVSPQRSNAIVLGVAGFDYRPARIVPALGSRVVLQWLGLPRGLDVVHLSLTALYGLGGPRSDRWTFGVSTTLPFAITGTRNKWAEPQ